MYFNSVISSSYLEGPITPDFCFFVLQEDNTYKWKCEERGQCFHVEFYIQQVLVAPLVVYSEEIT